MKVRPYEYPEERYNKAQRNLATEIGRIQITDIPNIVTLRPDSVWQKAAEELRAANQEVPTIYSPFYTYKLPPGITTISVTLVEEATISRRIRAMAGYDHFPGGERTRASLSSDVIFSREERPGLVDGDSEKPNIPIILPRFYPRRTKTHLEPAFISRVTENLGSPHDVLPVSEVKNADFALYEVSNLLLRIELEGTIINNPRNKPSHTQ